jgi:ParB-like chromosome segregation protein Spo0J
MAAPDNRAAPDVFAAPGALSNLTPQKIIYYSVEELRPNPRNARTHRKRKIRDLAKEIKALGFIGAIIIDETGMVLAGHARYEAAKSLGLTIVPTVTVVGLSPEQKRAFALADNKFSERAGWDRELLADELKELAVGRYGKTAIDSGRP